jgi:predicted DNA-binding transcriptional regulator AlpA
MTTARATVQRRRAPASTDLPDVVGPAEAAQIVGVGPRRFQQLIRAYDGRFPAARELEIGRVWDRAEIEAWTEDRSGTRLAALRAYRRTGTVARAADVAGVSWTTAKAWLVKLRVI